MTPRQLKFGLINNNKNKWPFRHPFENRYLKKVLEVCLLAYGTLFTKEKPSLKLISKGKSQGNDTFAQVSFVWRLGSYIL